MSQWGARARDRKRRTGLVNNTFDSVKDSVRRKTIKLKKLKLERPSELKLQISNLYQDNKLLVGRDNIHKLRDNLIKIKQMEDECKYILDDKPFEEFVELVTPLLEVDNSNKETHVKKQQKHTIFLNVFHKDKVIPSFIEREICSNCNKELVIVSNESVVTCPSCGDSEHLIYCNSDFIENTEFKTVPYERGPLYKKYLMQFHENAPVPPIDVINIVYKHLSKVHMMLSTKVKPTPIAQILREEKLQKWTPFAVRIAKYINKEHIVSLSQELIDRLVLRFEKVTHVFKVTKLKHRKKIMNFEFLTKQFLDMENRPDLAEWFSCHKTRLVLKQADSRLLRCSKHLSESDDLDWNMSRSC